MPYYLFKNNETGEEYTELMGISACDTFLEENPHIEKLYNGGPLLHTGSNINGRKPDDGFRDVLREIKAKHSQGYRLGKSNINTF